MHIVVAILIAVGEVPSPMTQAMTDAMTGAVAEALGPETSLVLRTTPVPSDDEALSIERELGAAAVARVVWDGPDQTIGVLRAHLRASNRWFERRVTFSPADSRAERGRTLGFAFASLLLTAREPGQTAGPGGPERSSPAAVEATPAAAPATVVMAAPPAAPQPTAPPHERTLAIELAGLAATGIGGPTKSLGASLHVEWALGGHFFARTGAAVLIGPVPGLNGEDTLGALGAGLAFRPRIPDASNALGLGVTLEALGLYQDLSHRASTGTTLHEGHLLAGATANVEASWRVSRALDLFAALGADVVFTSTLVSVAGQDVATLPLVRPTAQAGLRWHN